MTITNNFQSRLASGRRVPITVRTFSLVVVFVSLVSVGRADIPSTQPSDPQLWVELRAIDAKSAGIPSVSADFEQRKFTAMMKKPLVSSGNVTASENVALWKTSKPQPTAMLVSPKEIRIYYPSQSVVEIYPVQGQLGALAASPLPRLETLKKFFSFERTKAALLDPTTNDEKYLAVKLTPNDEQLKQHVKQVRVLLDRGTGAMRSAETTDVDGERTLMIFSSMKFSSKPTPDALQLSVEPGTKEVHPLAGLGDGAEGGRP